MKLLNAISINMLPRQGGVFKYTPISMGKALLDYKSNDGHQGVDSGYQPMRLDVCIGHQDLCNVLTKMVRDKLPNLSQDWSGYQANRVTLSLEPGETVIVAQYIGERLPEGTTVLPEGSTISFFKVEVQHLERDKEQVSALRIVNNIHSEVRHHKWNHPSIYGVLLNGRMIPFTIS